MAGRLWALGLVLVTLALAGCDDGGDESTTTSSSTQPTSTKAETAAPAENAAPKDAPALYFTAGEQFEKVRTVLPPGGIDEQLEAATEALVDGPPKSEEDADTQIPADTEVEGVEVGEDGTATVEVSADFLAGSRRERPSATTSSARRSRLGSASSPTR